MRETSLRLECGCEASAPYNLYDEIDLYHSEARTWVCTVHGSVRIIRISRHRSA